MVTSAPVRRLSSVLIAVAVAGPAVCLGGAAWAAGPAPEAQRVLGPTVPVAPAPQPSGGGTWISGGTLLESTSTTPATKPVAKPAAPARTTSRTASRTGSRTTTHQATHRVTAPATTGAPDGATALPFTGGHVDALLPSGILLVVGGVTLTLLARPRRVLA